MYLSVLLRRQAELAAENPVEIAGIPVTAFGADIRHLAVCFHKQFAGAFRPQLCEIADITHSCLLFDLHGKVVGRKMDAIRQHGKGNIFCVMLFDIGNNIFNRVILSAFLREISAAAFKKLQRDGEELFKSAAASIEMVGFI